MSNGAAATHHMRCGNQWDHCPAFNIYTNIITFRTQSILSTHLRSTYPVHSYFNKLLEETSSYLDEYKVIDNCKVTCQSRYDELIILGNAKPTLSPVPLAYFATLIIWWYSRMQNDELSGSGRRCSRAFGVGRAVSADD